MTDTGTIAALDTLPAEQRRLVEQALAATQQAHAPYSRFRVGASLRYADGSSSTAANFENASYGLSLCAETVAIAAASSAGRLPQLSMIAIAAIGELDAAVTGDFIAPCGRCRQILAEAVGICGHDITVLMLSRDGLRVRTSTARTLLPLAFGL